MVFGWHDMLMLIRTRTDPAGTLYYIIAAGIERRRIFTDDVDRDKSKQIRGISCWILQPVVGLKMPLDT